MKTKLPIYCPSCTNTLLVTQLSCVDCETSVIGKFNLPVLLQITEEEQNFILQFVLASGSLKEMASQMGNSYPTIRNKLDEIIEKIQILNKSIDA